MNTNVTKIGSFGNKTILKTSGNLIEIDENGMVEI